MDEILVKDVLELGCSRASKVVYGLSSDNSKLSLGLSISEKILILSEQSVNKKDKNMDIEIKKFYFLIDGDAEVYYFATEDELKNYLKLNYEIINYQMSNPRIFIEKNKGR